MRRVAMLLLSILTILQPALPSSAQEAKIKVTMGWQPTMNGARFFIAEAEGLFTKEGLELNLVKFTAGPPFFAAFQSGSIDVGFLGFQPAVTAVAQGIAVKIVAVENDAGGAEGLVARQDSGIKGLADLRGKKVATKRGSSAHTALLTGLKIGGLNEFGHPAHRSRCHGAAASLPQGRHRCGLVLGAMDGLAEARRRPGRCDRSRHQVARRHRVGRPCKVARGQPRGNAAPVARARQGRPAHSRGAAGRRQAGGKAPGAHRRARSRGAHEAGVLADQPRVGCRTPIPSRCPWRPRQPAKAWPACSRRMRNSRKTPTSSSSCPTSPGAWIPSRSPHS